MEPSPSPPPLQLPSTLASYLPPYRNADGRPYPVGTALLFCLIAASASRRRNGNSRVGSTNRLFTDKKSTRAERIAYQVDNFFSTKAYAPAALLCAITVVLVLVGGVSLWVATDMEKSLLSTMWMAWRFVTDGGDYDETVGARLVGVVLVLSGMLFFALLVGLIGETIEQKLDDMKQGKNRVIEQGHTLVLGYSDKFMPLAAEIAKANESEGGGVVVVLSDAHEKTWMDDTVAEELPEEERYGTQIVCRSGDPVSVADLRKVAAADAKAIIVLADYTVDADVSDARAVRCMLALRAGVGATRNTVVELRDIDNLPTLELVTSMKIGSDNGHAEGEGSLIAGSQPPVVRTLVPHDIIGRLMIQCARQRNLAEVYDALCGFDGMEFYFKEWPTLTGLRWGEAIVRARAAPLVCASLSLFFLGVP